MKLEPLTDADLDWGEDGIPRSVHYDDVYYSTDDAVEESTYVFLQHNRLQERFQQAQSGDVFRIVETGFGTGLNLLLTLQMWQVTESKADLHFLSFEKFPLNVEVLQQAHRSYPDLADLAEQLRAQYPFRLPGWHDVWLMKGRVRLTLWFGDVLTGLPEVDASEGNQVDAWFLDGFTPAKNPDMWQPGLFQQMARLSHKKTTFATFTSAGDVRRQLQKAGFEVKKASGWGKKREMCFGSVQQSRPFSLKAPWFSRPLPVKAKKAVVVGAGLSGATVAYALAQKGFEVTVLEAQSQAATQASGNLAGAVHPLVTADWNLRSQWYLQGFEATLRWLLPWLDSKEIQGDLSGLVQLTVSEVGATRVQEALQRVGLPNDFAIPWNHEKTADELGMKVASESLFFPHGGWVNPPSVVNRCLQHANITVEYGVNLQQYGFDEVGSTWNLETNQGEYSAPILVIASGALDETLNQSLGLPIRPVKGQVTHLNDGQQQPLPYVTTHEGYSAPCPGGAVTGATFEAPDMSEVLSDLGHEKNLLQAQNALPEWLNENIEPSDVSGRVAFRPTTPDHLPIIGPVPDPSWMQAAYIEQSHTHAVYRYPLQKYLTGLFVSNGHGARGLMSVFLAAESIVADITGSALRQPLALYHASHPARFKIRYWRSGKVKK